MNGRMSGTFSIKAFLAPVQLSRNGKRLELRYLMPPTLVEQALSTRRTIPSSSKSSSVA